MKILDIGDIIVGNASSPNPQEVNPLLVVGAERWDYDEHNVEYIVIGKNGKSVLIHKYIERYVSSGSVNIIRRKDLHKLTS